MDAGAVQPVRLILTRIPARKNRLQGRDGYAVVAMAWIVLCLFGAVPYVLSGAVPTMLTPCSRRPLAHHHRSTILTDVEAMPRGILFWRALTQWMGGMGILVLMLALLPKLSEGSVNLMKAESPGPISTKLRPRTGETARILYRIYIALTVAEALLLRIAGLPLFDAITTALTTISTGGFSIRDASIAYYQSHLVNWILIFFMFAASVNLRSSTSA